MINNICICNDCMIGSGTVVIRDIVEKGTYIGVPAKRLENNYDSFDYRSSSRR